MSYAEARLLRDLATLRRQRVGSSDLNRPHIGLREIISGRGLLAQAPPPPERNSQRSTRQQKFEPGDLLFGKALGSAKAWLADFPGRCSLDFIVLTPHNIHPNYLLYSLLSPTFLGAAKARATGSSLPIVNWVTLGAIALPTPPLEVQEAISHRLETDLVRLDKLIAAKTRTLELIEERRTSVLWPKAGFSRLHIRPPLANLSSLKKNVKLAIQLLKERRGTMIDEAIYGNDFSRAA